MPSYGEVNAAGFHSPFVKMTFKSTFPTPKEARRATYVRNMHRALMAAVSDGAPAGSPRAIWLFTPASRNRTGIGSRAGRQNPPDLSCSKRLCREV